MATQQGYAPADPGVAGLDGGRVRLTSTQLDDLDSRIDGQLLCAGNEGWDGAVEIWNAMVAKLPALVVQPESARDVAVAVRFAPVHKPWLGAVLDAGDLTQVRRHLHPADRGRRADPAPGH